MYMYLEIYFIMCVHFTMFGFSTSSTKKMRRKKMYRKKLERAIKFYASSNT